jgi:acetyl-CoA C-acetyltransferase
MNPRPKAVIVSAVRTPIGSFNGVFRLSPATKLGGIAIGAALKRIDLPGDSVDQVIMGCVLTAGLGQAPARQASISAGLPNSVGATTVNKVCSSSLKSVTMAAQAIGERDARIVVAGGMESMSRTPYSLNWQGLVIAPFIESLPTV